MRWRSRAVQRATQRQIGIRGGLIGAEISLVLPQSGFLWKDIDGAAIINGRCPTFAKANVGGWHEMEIESSAEGHPETHLFASFAKGVGALSIHGSNRGYQKFKSEAKKTEGTPVMNFVPGSWVS